jgi:hypothetical protein
MFYKTGIDITNDKQMFKFLKEHFDYPTMNSWNRLCSVANNVKLYRLGLSGDWTTALSLLETGGYDEIRWMIDDWCRERGNVEVYFNGRSGGYLILKSTNNNDNILPEYITESIDYDEYKRYCKEYCGSVKENRDDLVYYTVLVRDFDKLCDEIREYVDGLSKMKFEVIEMEKAVYEFNDLYADDLDLLGFDPLTCDGEGVVDISEIMTLQCLVQAFWRVADRKNLGYVLDCLPDNPSKIRYITKC